MKNKRGITLIALVVTVIVLLILAAIGISALTGNNSIITSSREAKLKTEVKEIIEVKDQKEALSSNIQFGDINELLDLESEYNDKLSIENGEIVYDPNKVTETEKEWLEEIGVFASSRYYLIVDEKNIGKYTDSNVGTIYDFRDLVNKENTNGKNSELALFSDKYDKAYLAEDIDIGAKTDSTGNWIDSDTGNVATTNWNTIGRLGSNSFNSIFDGNNHMIYGIYINESTSGSQGIFGINRGTIKNLILANSYIVGADFNGGIVAQNYGTIENCENRADIIVTTGGGIVGRNFSKITNCTNSGYINARSWAAGICGLNEQGGIVSGCSNTHELLLEDFAVGGIVGLNSGKVEKCYNEGELLNSTISGSRYGKGGIVGRNANTGIVKYCFNTANVAHGGWAIAGVVGDNIGTCEFAYNIGTIVGNSSTGGVVGDNSGTSKYCYDISQKNVIGSGSGIAENCLDISESQMLSNEDIIMDDGSSNKLINILNKDEEIWEQNGDGYLKFI